MYAIWLNFVKSYDANISTEKKAIQTLVLFRKTLPKVFGFVSVVGDFTFFSGSVEAAVNWKDGGQIHC